MGTGYLNLHGAERFLVNLGFRFTELVEGSNLYKVFTVFTDEYIAHGDVVLGVAGDDFDFTYWQWLTQVHGKVMFLADGAATPEEGVALAIECIFGMVRRIPRNVGIDVGITNQRRLFL